MGDGVPRVTERRAPLRRAVSDAQSYSRFKSTASLQLGKGSQDAETPIFGTQKNLQTARLKSVIDFFRVKEQTDEHAPTDPSCSFTPQARPTSFHGSLSAQNNTDPVLKAPIRRRIRNPLQRAHTVSMPSYNGTNSLNFNLKFNTEPGEKHEAVYSQVMNNGHAHEGKDTGQEVNSSGQNQVMTEHTENRVAHQNGILPSLDDLKQKLANLENELYESTGHTYEKRRLLRADIREIKEQIKEEKYSKDGSAQLQEISYPSTNQTSSLSTLTSSQPLLSDNVSTHKIPSHQTDTPPQNLACQANILPQSTDSSTQQTIEESNGLEGDLDIVKIKPPLMRQSSQLNTVTEVHEEEEEVDSDPEVEGHQTRSRVYSRQDSSDPEPVAPLEKAPDISFPLMDCTVREGRTATFICHVTATPKPIIMWQRDKTFLRAGSQYKQTYDGTIARLEIKFVTIEEAGQYTCTARNEHGRETCSCRLTIKDKNGTVHGQLLSDTNMSKDINSMNDEDELHKMLSGTEDFDERKKIRARMREIREAKSAAYEKKKAEAKQAEEAEFERQRKEREESSQDAVKLRQRQAEEAKARKMKEYQERASGGRKDAGIVEDSIRKKHAAADAEKQRKLDSYTEMGKVMSNVYHTGSDILMKAEDDQQKRLEGMNEEGVSRSTKTEKHTDGGTTTTATTVTTQRTKDGATTTVKQTKQVTQSSGLGGTSYTVQKTSADDVAKKLADTFQTQGLPTTSGIINVRTEAWSSKDGITKRTEKTQAWGKSAAKTGPRGARAAFQQMDKSNPTPVGGGPGLQVGGGRGRGRVAVQRSPSTIKQMLLDWCKAMTTEYEHKIQITNFSSCWNNGIAFCALIHHFFPKSFDFEALDPKNRRYNFNLAFDTAEKEADIAPLLDVEDMVRMKNPDWKCVFTYVQSIYRHLREKQPVT